MQHLVQKRQEIEKLRTSSSISTVQVNNWEKVLQVHGSALLAEIPKDRFAAPISEGSHVTRFSATTCFELLRR